MTRRLGTHAYTADRTVPADRNGRGYCTCGAPQTHPRHTLPDTDPDQRAAELRRVGERED